MTTKKTRVRFAPSPTGMLHVGNARTALYNWLFARHTDGEFLLRVEDTDLERSEARYETQLIQDLHWLGLDWDEGPGAAANRDDNADTGPHAPYRQSDRLDIYREHAAQLLAAGKAYRCFCNSHEYVNPCRTIEPADSLARAAAGQAHAIYLKVPDTPLRFHDLVRGDVEFATGTVDDFVLVRSGTDAAPGIPVYNYVVAIDDALMEITHVIRGDDHISNTPKQVAVFEAFGWPVPEFAHLSTILGADRERLSKRHGATSIASFREMGILPEALTNYLALLGWGAEDGKSEIFSLDELAKEFKLERVTPSPAIFDFVKLHWLNRHYLKAASAERLVDLALPFFPEFWPPALSPQRDLRFRTWFGSLLTLFVPTVDTLQQLPQKAAIAILHFDVAAAKADPENAAVLASPSAYKVLDALASRVRSAGDAVTAERFKAWMNEIKAETGAKGKELFHPVRVLLTGAHSGPEFDKLIPLIEEGSALDLPAHVLSVRERVERFYAVRS